MCWLAGQLAVPQTVGCTAAPRCHTPLPLRRPTAAQPTPQTLLLLAPQPPGLLGRAGLLRAAGHGGGLPAAAPLAPAAGCAPPHAENCLRPACLLRRRSLSGAGGCIPPQPTLHCAPSFPRCPLAASAHRFGSARGAPAARELEGSLGVLLLDFLRLYGRALNNTEASVVCWCAAGAARLSWPLFAAA